MIVTTIIVTLFWDLKKDTTFLAFKMADVTMHLWHIRSKVQLYTAWAGVDSMIGFSETSLGAFLDARHACTTAFMVNH